MTLLVSCLLSTCSSPTESHLGGKSLFGSLCSVGCVSECHLCRWLKTLPPPGLGEAKGPLC